MRIGGSTDISDRGSIPLISISRGYTGFDGVLWGITETCLDKQKIDAKNIEAANKIVRFSRQSAPVAA